MPVERPRVAEDVVVEIGDDVIVPNSGLHLVSLLADQVGLAEAVSDSVLPKSTGGYFVRDRGRIVTQVALMLAAGGECLADVSMLRQAPELFGNVASDATVWRTFENDLRAEDWDRIWTRMAAVRSAVWDRYGLAPGRAYLDLDATLSNVKTEKEGAAPTFKGGFGYHPVNCFLDRDGTAEPLAGMLRPGNATANDAADQLAVLDAAIAQLPERYRAGHRPGDDPAAVGEMLIVRADTAADSAAMLAGMTARNVEFLISARANDELARAIGEIEAQEWRPARVAKRKRRKSDPGPVDDVERSAVAEITDAVRLRRLPAGTRVIVRRELRHPGAQMRLFDTDLHRYQVIYTRLDGDAVDLEFAHRQRARCEQQIAIYKDTGGDRWPFEHWEANRNWLQVVLLGHTLLSWLAHAAFDGDLHRARPKRLRRQIFAAPARIINHARHLIVRVSKHWRWHGQINTAYLRLALRT